MQRFSALMMVSLLSGCAVPKTVQRIGVGYNNAVADLSNELTLLNVIRAKDGFPLHYTSVSRLTGSLTMRLSGGLNAQLKQDAVTNTNTTSATTAATGTTSVVSAVQALVEGGNVYTPSIGGEVSTSPSFDVIVNDSKEFYQGISTSMNALTLNSLLEQSFDSREVLSLAIAKVDFRLKSRSRYYVGEAGSIVSSIKNDGTVDGDQLGVLFSCYAFTTETQKASPVSLAPVSRVTQQDARGPRISIQELAMLDGTALDLSGKIGTDARGDDRVEIVRPGQSSTVGRFTWIESISPSCPLKATLFLDHKQIIPAKLPASPPANRVFAGEGKMLVTASDSNLEAPVLTLVNVDISMTIRSPDAVVRFVGECLRKLKAGSVLICKVGGVTLFELREGSGSGADISANLNGRRYHVASSTPAGLASLRTLSLIQRLINLHKSSTDKAVTQAVRVVS